MELSEVLVFGLTLLVMFVGIIGAVMPVLPGPPIVFVAALGHKLIYLERSVPWWVVIAIGVLMAVSLILEFVASSIGAKQLGATWWGATGAVVGGLLGFVWFPIGLLLGPILGAVLFELASGRVWRDAGRAGVGAFVGLVAGTFGKLVACVGMTALFVGSYIWERIGGGGS